MRATRWAQDKTNSKLSASANIIYYYNKQDKLSLNSNYRHPLTKTN